MSIAANVMFQMTGLQKNLTIIMTVDLLWKVLTVLLAVISVIPLFKKREAHSDDINPWKLPAPLVMRLKNL